MKYYKDTNNKVFAYEEADISKVDKTTLTEITTPIYNGQVLKGHPNIGEVETKEDGSLYTYYNQDGTPDLVKETVKSQAEALTTWKQARTTAVSNIEVTYNSIVYQGDETSQTRMTKAITALPDDTTTVYWTAKDNTIVSLTKVDLKAILLDAGSQQTVLWNQGRP